MSIGSWFKAHRKPLITHTSIIAAFVLLVIFVAEPLFDRLEQIPGEAEVHRFHLPTEPEAMRCSIGKFETDGRTTVEIQGWAFIEDQDSEGSDIYVVLKSGRRTYIFDTMVRMRPDVTRHFADMGLDLDHSGFTALLPARRIADGEYTVGIYIRKGDVEALQYTGRAITKSGGTIEVE